MNEILSFPKIEESIEEFLERNYSENQRKIISFLVKIDDEDSIKVYKTAIFCLLKKDIPAKELLISHCLNELINSLLRRKEDEQREAFLKSVREISFVKSGEHGDDKIKEVAASAFKTIKEKLGNELVKIQEFVNQHLKARYSTSFLSNAIKQSKDDLQKYRHYNGGLRTGVEQMTAIFNNIEEALLELSLGYIDRIKTIDKSLEEANQIPFKKPGSNIDRVLVSLTDSTEGYFFKHLENPEWIEPLTKKGFFTAQIINQNQTSLSHLSHGSYLAKITKDKPEEVFKAIEPFLQNELGGGKSISGHSLLMLFKISSSFPANKNLHSKKIGEAYKKWINSQDKITEWLDVNEIAAFSRNLITRGYDDLTLAIVEASLKLTPEISTKQIGEYTSTEAKFKNKICYGQIDGYYYTEFLKDVYSLLISSHSYELFTIFYYIFKNAVDAKSLKEVDEKLCYARSAIEEHQQDRYNKGPEFKIISAIRDSAEIVFEKEPNKAALIIKKLEEKLSNDYQPLLFIRIILHLLRKFPDNKKLISKYLSSKKYFYNPQLHHEYYSLLGQEFSSLRLEDQNKILSFVEKGPKLPTKNKEIDEGYKRYWTFAKLHCIRNSLSDHWKEKYEVLKKEFAEPENPDLLHYSYEARFVGGKSPIEDKDLEKKSLSEIISYLAEWKPEGGFDKPTPRGFGDIIIKDFEKNPRKYLDDLEQLKAIKNPTYIKRILSSLGKFNEKTAKDLEAIIDLGKWITSQDVLVIAEYQGQSGYDSDLHWGWCKQELCRLLVGSFKQKDDDQNTSLLKLKNEIFEILKALTLQQDPTLEELDNNTGNDRYYMRAINSCHGEAFAALIEFGLWLARNKKEELASELITPILTKLLAESEYLETWAIFGRYLPWLILLNKEWVKNNLDKILPESNRKEFDAGWLTYINFVEPFNDAFEVSKKKYLFVLEGHLYNDTEKNRSERRLGESVAIFYSRGKIELEDELITAIFDGENSEESSAMISSIGRWSGNENHKLPDKFLKRFQELWDWRMLNIKGKEKDFLKELEAFCFWYGFGEFDRKWAIDHFLKIVKILAEHNAKVSLIFVKKQLAKDVEVHRDIAGEIMKVLLKRDGYHYDNIDIARIYFAYFPEDKDTKNQFCENYGLNDNLENI